jgi:hypothetical protein
VKALHELLFELRAPAGKRWLGSLAGVASTGSWRDFFQASLAAIHRFDICAARELDGQALGSSMVRCCKLPLLHLALRVAARPAGRARRSHGAMRGQRSS